MKNVAIGSDASPARRRPGSARAFSRVLVEYGELRADPSEVLDDHEVARLLDRIPVTTPLELRDRAMFELACSRGLRAEELVKLDLGALELDPGEPAMRAVTCYLQHGRGALARDLRVLLDAGWSLTELRGLDLFPMTEHVELVAVLEPPDQVL